LRAARASGESSQPRGAARAGARLPAQADRRGADRLQGREARLPHGHLHDHPADLLMSALDPSLIRFEEIVPPGANWSHVLKRGTTLRITDAEGGANVAALFYNFELPGERLNLPDTLKCQHTARLTKGHCLYSDMGRVLVSIPGDTCGWHDPLA